MLAGGEAAEADKSETCVLLQQTVAFSKEKKKRLGRNGLSISLVPSSFY